MESLTVLHNVGAQWLPQTQTWLYNQIRYLPKDIQSHIVCQNTINLDQFPWPNIHSLQKSSYIKYILERGFRKLQIQNHLPFVTKQLASLKANILHSHFGTVGWGDLTPAQEIGSKHIVTFYGRDVNYYPRSDTRWFDRYKEMFASVDAILCEGPFMAKCIIALGCPKNKVIVHHLGVGVDQIQFQPRSWSPGEELRVFLAASFQEKKGFPNALAALGILKKSIPLSITIIGDSTGEARSQKEKQKILDTVAKYQLNSKIRWLGFQPHMVMLKEAYHHHIFLSPSITAIDGDTEGGAPVSLIEMAATGMPIISTNHCDIPNVIIPNQTGYLAEENDVDGLVHCFEKLLNRPDSWADLIMAGRQRMETAFDARQQGKRLAKIYHNISSPHDYSENK